MTCPSCGAAVLESSRFCPRCGAVQPVGATAAPGAAAGADYAGFWRRFAAIFVDGVIVFSVTLIAVAPLAILSFGLTLGSDAGAAAAAVWNLGAFAVSWLYEALMISSRRQATLGKQALGVRVSGMDGGRISFLRATGRFFAKSLSGMILLVGYLIQPFTRKRQALHDILASTLVVRAPR